MISLTAKDVLPDDDGDVVKRQVFFCLRFSPAAVVRYCHEKSSRCDAERPWDGSACARRTLPGKCSFATRRFFGARTESVSPAGKLPETNVH